MHHFKCFEGILSVLDLQIGRLSKNTEDIKVSIRSYYYSIHCSILKF